MGIGKERREEKGKKERTDRKGRNKGEGSRGRKDNGREGGEWEVDAKEWERTGR